MKIEIEKPTIPQFVAEWLEECKGWNDYEQEYDGDNAIDLFSAMDLDNAGMQDNVQNYLVDNTETFARAWLDDYEVEEKQKYVLLINITDKASKTNYETYLNKRGIFHSMENESFNSEEFNWSEEEIKDLENGEILFEHFAVKVEEVE